MAPPLRVTSERVAADDRADDRAAERTISAPRDPGPAVGSPAHGTAGTGGADGVAAVVGLAGQDRDGVADLSAVPAVAPALPAPAVRGGSVLAPTPARAPSPRPGAWARLAAFVSGRRRAAGRHRPDEVPVRGWSMSAPSGRPPGRRRNPRPR